jgi:hypothetical protein
MTLLNETAGGQSGMSVAYIVAEDCIRQQDMAMENENREKREVQRFEMHLHAVVQKVDQADQPFDLHTRDISSDGAYICMDHPLPVNTPVELTFFLPIKKQIRSKILTNGRVVRSEQEGMAVRFGSSYQIHAV